MIDRNKDYVEIMERHRQMTAKRFNFLCTIVAGATILAYFFAISWWLMS